MEVILLVLTIQALYSEIDYVEYFEIQPLSLYYPIADSYTDSNQRLDPTYRRDDPKPPNDIFNWISPYFYKIFYIQYMWTWTPVEDYYDYYIRRSIFLLEKSPLDPMRLFKRFVSYFYGFEPRCLDVGENYMKKLIQLSLSLPVWLVVIYLATWKLLAILIIVLAWVPAYLAELYIWLVRYIRDLLNDALMPIYNFWNGLVGALWSWHLINMWFLGWWWYLFVYLPIWIPI